MSKDSNTPSDDASDIIEGLIYFDGEEDVASTGDSDTESLPVVLPDLTEDKKESNIPEIDPEADFISTPKEEPELDYENYDTGWSRTGSRLNEDEYGGYKKYSDDYIDEDLDNELDDGLDYGLSSGVKAAPIKNSFLDEDDDFEDNVSADLWRSTHNRESVTESSRAPLSDRNVEDELELEDDELEDDLLSELEEELEDELDDNDDDFSYEDDDEDEDDDFDIDAIIAKRKRDVFDDTDDDYPLDSDPLAAPVAVNTEEYDDGDFGWDEEDEDEDDEYVDYVEDVEDVEDTEPLEEEDEEELLNKYSLFPEPADEETSANSEGEPGEDDDDKSDKESPLDKVKVSLLAGLAALKLKYNGAKEEWKNKGKGSEEEPDRDDSYEPNSNYDADLFPTEQDYDPYEDEDTYGDEDYEEPYEDEPKPRKKKKPKNDDDDHDNNTSSGSFSKVGLLVPVIVLVGIAVFTNFRTVAPIQTDALPDSGRVVFLDKKVSAEGDIMSLNVRNEGASIAKFRPIYTIYGMELSNPVTYFKPKVYTQCIGEKMILEIGDNKTINAGCDIPEGIRFMRLGVSVDKGEFPEFTDNE